MGFLPTDHRGRGPRRWRGTRLIAALFLGLAGCGYEFGYEPIPGVRSVAVPIFENRSFERRIEERLTSLVADEIARRTPYRLTSPADADGILLGSILRVERRALVEGALDRPLERGVTIAVTVRLVAPDGRTIIGPIDLEERAESPRNPALGEHDQATPGAARAPEAPDAALDEALRDLAARIAWELESW